MYCATALTPSLQKVVLRLSEHGIAIETQTIKMSQ